VKIITVPEKAVIKDEKGAPVEGLDLPFKKVLIQHLDAYGDVKTISQIREAQKVIDAIEAGNGTISLEDKQYELLAAACKNKVYQTAVTRQLLAYYDCVERAEEAKK
jgi:hypothetical protein